MAAVALDFKRMLKEARSAAALRKEEIKLHEVRHSESSSTATFTRFSSSPQIEDVFYCSEFLTKVEEQELLAFLTTNNDANHKWQECGGRRVKILGGVPHHSGSIIEGLPPPINKLAERLSPFFDGGNKPNQVLLNCYVKGSGIRDHNDGPLYCATAAIISLESSAMLHFIKEDQTPRQSREVGGGGAGGGGDGGRGGGEEEETMMEAAPSEALSIFLPARSMVVFSKDLYRNYKHGISAVLRDTIDARCINAPEAGMGVGDVVERGEVRYSLTFRLVRHVAKVIDEFGPLNVAEEEEVS